MSGDHATARNPRSRALVLALLINASFMVVEVTAGALTRSLVLIADAGHMLTDVLAVAAALLAIWLARRPANQRKTYGYQRTEILAALGNALLLLAVSAYILVEAYRRFANPPHVSGWPILGVATVGLGANLAGAFVLAGGGRSELNVRAAFLDMIADVFGSLGAIAAAVLILATGWQYADPLFAAAAAIVILPRTWHLLASAVDVLLEGTPPHMKLTDVQETILAVPGVWSVHDLHIWTVTSGFVALSGHVEVADNVDRDDVLVQLRAHVQKQFEISHITIQVENELLAHELDQECFPGQEAYHTHLPHPPHAERSPTSS